MPLPACDIGHSIRPLPDGEHASTAWSQEPCRDDILRPAERSTHHWNQRCQDPQQPGLPDHGSDSGILCPSAGRT